MKFKVRTSFVLFFKGSNRAKESEILGVWLRRCVWLRKLCTVRRVLDFHPRTEMSVLRMQFMEYGIISRKLCAPYPRSWPGRNVCGVALHRPVFATAPSTHLTDQEEGFHPVLEGASQILRELQLCYQSRAPGQWAWEQSGRRKQTSSLTDPTLQSQALIRSTILAMSCFHSTFLKSHMSAKERPMSTGSL